MAIGCTESACTHKCLAPSLPGACPLAWCRLRSQGTCGETHRNTFCTCRRGCTHRSRRRRTAQRQGSRARSGWRRHSLLAYPRRAHITEPAPPGLQTWRCPRRGCAHRLACLGGGVQVVIAGQAAIAGSEVPADCGARRGGGPGGREPSARNPECACGCVWRCSPQISAGKAPLACSHVAAPGCDPHQSSCSRGSARRPPGG